jgi:hypothetical protein
MITVVMLDGATTESASVTPKQDMMVNVPFKQSSGKSLSIVALDVSTVACASVLLQRMAVAGNALVMLIAQESAFKYVLAVRLRVNVMSAMMPT